MVRASGTVYDFHNYCDGNPPIIGDAAKVEWQARLNAESSWKHYATLVLFASISPTSRIRVKCLPLRELFSAISLRMHDNFVLHLLFYLFEYVIHDASVKDFFYIINTKFLSYSFLKRLPKRILSTL